MNGDEARVARLVRLEIVALVNAVDDLAAGRYTPEQRCHLTGGLDTLAAALRERETTTVVESEGVEPQRGELRQRPGFLDGEVLQG